MLSNGEGVSGGPIQHTDSSPGASQEQHNLSGLEGVVVDIEDEGLSEGEGENGIVGGHATNLDGLDKDQIMRMID